MKLRDSKKISETNLFGTHDSLTAYVDMEKVCRCQSLTLREQLVLGVRLIDVRLNRKKDGFYLVHSLADCYEDKDKKIPLTFSSVLNDCLGFLEKNPDEFIVMSVKQDRGIQSRFFFPAFYSQYISGNEEKWYLGSEIPTVAECRGKIVLMRRCKVLPKYSKGTPCGLDFSHWRDQGKTRSAKIYPVKLSKTQTATVQDRYGLSPERKWYKCEKPFLDRCKCDGDNICVHFISTAFRYKNESLVRTAAEMNAFFKEYEFSEGKGWFFFDFPDEEIAKKFAKENNYGKG
ncbi:MAG: hypothetical protein E7543_04460 [Ruminococcaceae bacterium]|nr:hypothetical protein [Oscillospiraceae bacterium]